MIDIDIPDGYYEHIYITVHYPCNHAMLRTVRREAATARQNAGLDREVWDVTEDRCPNCQIIARERALARSEKY